MDALGIGHVDGTCLAGMRIGIIGDSLLHQVLQAIECRLQKHVLSRTVVDTWTYQNSTMEKRVHVLFANGMRLDYVFIGKNLTEHPLQSTTAPEALWTLLGYTPDVLITNLGTFHLTDLEYNRAHRKKKVLSYGPVFSAFPGRVLLVGTPAKHVHERGSLVCGQDGISLAELRHWSPNQREGLLWQKNAAVEWLGRKYNLSVVPVLATSLERIDAHVSTTDCSHYCITGLPTLWADMAFTFLCEEHDAG